jgi:hypothetical protein
MDDKAKNLEFTREQLRLSKHETIQWMAGYFTDEQLLELKQLLARTRPVSFTENIGT